MPSVHAPQVSTKKKRFGLFKLAVDTQHCIRQKNGTNAQFTAQDRRKFPSAKTVVRCLHKECTGREWPDEAACINAHPSLAVMAKQEESHPYFWWSDDPQPAKLAEVMERLEEQTKGKSKEERAEETKRATKNLPVIGLLTDEG